MKYLIDIRHNEEKQLRLLLAWFSWLYSMLRAFGPVFIRLVQRSPPFGDQWYEEIVVLFVISSVGFLYTPLLLMYSR